MDIDKIIAFEQDELNDDEVLKLFADGIKSGLVWQLQGFYGRYAETLIQQGYISPEGEIL